MRGLPGLRGQRVFPGAGTDGRRYASLGAPALRVTAPLAAGMRPFALVWSGVLGVAGLCCLIVVLGRIMQVAWRRDKALAVILAFEPGMLLITVAFLGIAFALGIGVAAACGAQLVRRRSIVPPSGVSAARWP